MVKAGALYFAIVIALCIAIITSSLLLLAAHYRNNYLKELRFGRLLNNIEAGMAFALTTIDSLDHIKTVDLYGNGTDSLCFVKKEWGFYEQVSLATFIQKDTLKQTLLIGTETDSVALYVSDENRALALSGKTKITGDVYAPKSGIKKGFAEGKSYMYEELVYEGKIGHSTKMMPKLDTAWLNRIRERFNEKENYHSLNELVIKRSFLVPTLYVDVSKQKTLKGNVFIGNIIIRSDSMITIGAACKFYGIQIYAPSICIEKGFEGSCQLFASDSIVIKDNAYLKYPSVAAVLKTTTSGQFPKITLGKGVKFEGIVLAHEDKRSALQTMISLDNATTISGEVYCTGMIKFATGVVVNGKVSCNRIMMQTSQNLYENLLIDVTLNRTVRSKYYLNSNIFNTQSANHVLKWLN